MQHYWPVVISLLCLLLTACGRNKEAPFTNIRWENSPIPEVQVDDEWYELVAAGNVPTEVLIRTAIDQQGRSWQDEMAYRIKRVILEAGGEADGKVLLTLRKGGEEISVSPEFSTDNWNSVLWKYGIDPGCSGPEGKGPGGEDLAYLADRIDGNRVPPAGLGPEVEAAGSLEEKIEIYNARFDDRPEWLRPGEAKRDLDKLACRLQYEYPYLHLRGAGVAAAFERVRSGIGEGISRRDLLLQIDKLIALLGDGHSGIDPSGSGDLLVEFLDLGVLPFHPVFVEGRVAAIDRRYAGFADSDHPFVSHIEGIPIAKWLAEAGEFTVRGTPALRRSSQLKRLRLVGLLARYLGVDLTNDKVTVTLVSEDGKQSTEREYDLEYEPFWSYEGEGQNTATGARILPGNVGYLPLRNSMSGDEDEVAELLREFQSLQSTDALIIDLRGNGGGQRDPLLELLPYFLPADHGPMVASVGALRIDEAIDIHPAEGYLKDRSMYPARSSRWSASERETIGRFEKSFDRSVYAPDSTFSDLHYLVIRPRTSEWYLQPVVLLMDDHNFSATDIFIGAFERLPQVTLMGTSTLGGSGYVRPGWLSYSSIKLGLSSMASFRPTGALYEFGIDPDIRLTKDLQYWKALFRGEDVFIQEALSYLSRARQPGDAARIQ